MSHVVVTNSSAKTVKVPTTPVTYLTEVRDEACQKFGVSKDQFTLKYVVYKALLHRQLTQLQGTTTSLSHSHNRSGSPTFLKAHDWSLCKLQSRPQSYPSLSNYPSHA